jgi:hypothetical protein
MKTQKEQLAESIHYEIDARKRLLEKLERIPTGLIAQSFPDGRWTTFWSSGFEFTLPFDFKLIEQARVFMAEQFPGFELVRENRFVWDSSKSAGHFLEYETREQYSADRAWFQIAFRTDRKGTTCILNPIGEKTVPVFEVICSEGAAEMAAQS